MELKSYELKESAVNVDERTFEGYAATWDKDQVDDIIHPGAFQKSINEAFPKNKIKVLWQHSEPLGMPLEMREDNTGLFVKGKISKTTLGDEAIELMRDGVVNQMSIGFRIPKGRSDIDENGIRHIREVKLIEFSPVTFPANEAAVITGVKNLHFALEKGFFPRETIEKMIQDLTALIEKEAPGQSTLPEDTPRPEEYDEIKAMLADMKSYAENKLY